MGNHFHLVLFAEKLRPLSRAQLEQFARARWGRLWKLKTRPWSDHRWDQFHKDLFDVSNFMRDLQGPFSTWVNKFLGRRGRLWAERFKSLIIEDDNAMQEILLYIELNPVRAGISELPEQWRGGSAYLRSIGEDDFLIPLELLFPEVEKHKVADYYRALLLHRGMNPSREDQAELPAHLIADHLRLNSIAPGLYRTRCRGLTDGLMAGSRSYINQQLERLILEGVYKKAKSPAPQLGAQIFTVREQRSHCRW